MLKQIMIPMAAFAVTVTGVSAFNPDVLEKIEVDITDTQVAALEEAHELRQAGADEDEIRAVLEEAGVDRETLQEVRAAVKEVRKEARAAIEVTLEAEDYDAFLEAADGTKLADAVTSETDFELLVEAYELKESGDKAGAAEIMAELGVEKHDKRGGRDHRGGDRD